MNNIKTIYFFTFLLFLGRLPLGAQQLDHKLGEFIVQLSDHYDEREALNQLKKIIKNGESLKIHRELVPQMGIYHLSVDFARVNEIEMLRFLRSTPTNLASMASPGLSTVRASSTRSLASSDERM